jgi:hypothetical protein
MEDIEITYLYAHVIPDNDSWANNKDLTENEDKPSGDARDQNWKTTSHLKSIEPMGQNAPRESNGPHLIKTIQQFEDGLPQNNSQKEESKTCRQVADGHSKKDSQQEESQLDNPTHEFVQQHYKCQPP